MKIQLRDEGITMIQDENHIDEKWENFEESEIFPTYLLLKGETDYFFPASGMHSNDFAILYDVVSKKIKLEEFDLLDEI